jgi:hypothetical protein
MEIFDGCGRLDTADQLTGGKSGQEPLESSPDLPPRPGVRAAAAPTLQKALCGPGDPDDHHAWKPTPLL